MHGVQRSEDHQNSLIESISCAVRNFNWFYLRIFSCSVREEERGGRVLWGVSRGGLHFMWVCAVAHLAWTRRVDRQLPSPAVVCLMPTPNWRTYAHTHTHSLCNAAACHSQNSSILHAAPNKIPKRNTKPNCTLIYFHFCGNSSAAFSVFPLLYSSLRVFLFIWDHFKCILYVSQHFSIE